MPGTQPSRLSPCKLQANCDLPTPCLVSGEGSRQNRAFPDKGTLFFFRFMLLQVFRVKVIRFHFVHLTHILSPFCATQAESNGRYGHVGTQSPKR